MASSRVARGSALLRWLEREGCEHSVTLGTTPSAGVGVFASRDVGKGEVLVSCPMRCVIGAAETRRGDADDETVAFQDAMDALRVADGSGDSPGSDDDREGTPVSDSTRMQLVLLRERNLAETEEKNIGCDDAATTTKDSQEEPRRGGYWRHYVASLPGNDLVACLPLSWSGVDLRRRLHGTALLFETSADLAELKCLQKALAKNQKEFPPETFNLDALIWAHAVFWSRAISLPQAGWGRAGEGCHNKKQKTEKRTAGDDGALTPLLDMCNHSSFSHTELRRRGARWQLVARRGFKKDEQVTIDYGGKGNGELLRRHGFVVPLNPYDTCSAWVSSDITIGFASSDDENPKRAEKIKILLHRGTKQWNEFPGGLDVLLRGFDAKHVSDAVQDVDEGLTTAIGNFDFEKKFDQDALRRLEAQAARMADAISISDDEKHSLAGNEDDDDQKSGFESTPGHFADRAALLYRTSQRELLLDLKELAETRRR